MDRLSKQGTVGGVLCAGVHHLNSVANIQSPDGPLQETTSSCSGLEEDNARVEQINSQYQRRQAST